MRASPALLGPFRRQIVVLTACVTALAMLLLTLVLQLILSGLSRGEVDRVLEQRADAVVSSVSAASDERLVVPDLDLDVGIVVYDAAGSRVAGTASPTLREQYDDLAMSAGRRQVAAGEGFRLLAEPFTTRSGLRGVVVVSERLAPYEEAERYALLVSLVTGALATAAAAAIAAWVVGRALRPVALLAGTAADWSEHDLGQRFDLGPPDNEITALAATLDTLLDKVAAAIRSEQRLTSELAHELRTPLTTIQGTADLALLRDELTPASREDLEQVAAAARRMAATVTTLLEMARTAPAVPEIAGMTSCSLAEAVRDALAAGGPQGAEVSTDVADHRLAMPAEVALRALAPVVDNARRHARSQVTVTARPTLAGLVDVIVTDDGPGVRLETGVDRGTIFEPGVTSGDGSGAGLGLSLARRMARSVGGDVVLEQSDDRTRFVVRLPQV